MMELISVIVPVYKGEKYLSDCLNSILSSTHTNLEVILVDDGSPDRCPGICDEYAQRDSRVQVIHQENQGIAGARNAGIRAATGKYIGFVDSDDVISPKLYEVLEETIRTGDSDVVACEYTISHDDLSMECCTNAKSGVAFAGVNAQLAVLTCAPSVRSDTWAGPFVWNRLYKREKIVHLFKKEYLIGEDLFFNWEYIKNSKSMTVVPARLYLYRQNEESVSGQYRKYQGSAERGISNAMLWETLAKAPEYTDAELRKYIEARAAYMAHGELWRIYAADEELTYKEYVNTARQLLRDHFSKIWADKETYSLRIRGLLGIGRYLFPLWAAASKLYGLHQRHRSI